MSKQLVSIFIPAFNSEKFLQECLRSVRKQTYGNTEVIVVDNYSKDRTREIAKQYSAKVILHKSARSDARNEGANHAKGEFILSIDSDMELTLSVVFKLLTIT